MLNRKFNILLIEDNKADIILTERTFNRIDANINLKTISNGTEAFQLFTNSQKMQFVPHLILLDINLPGISGMKVLQAIKNNQLYRVIPVIMLTTSNRQTQIKQAYQYNVNTYMSKPIDLQQFEKLLMSVKEYWMKFASLYQLE